MLKRFLLLFLTFFSLLSIHYLLFTPLVMAEGEFLTDVRVDYKIAPNGVTSVANTITLTNAFTGIYATTYILSLENLNPFEISASENSKSLPVSFKKTGSQSDIEVNFPDAVVGKGNSRTFTLFFNEDSFASKTGEIWEIAIPRIATSQNYTSYEVNVWIPKAFGKEAYISPAPLSISEKEGFLVYAYSREQIAKTGVTGGFGDFQVFSFVLNYHLENPLAKASWVEIAIPPDTNFQKIYYTSINPAPKDVFLDEDGNWIAKYELASRERIDVRAEGSVQIFASFRPFPKPSQDILNSNLKSNQYWQKTSPQILSLARRLQTPKEIYNFVTETLSYDFQRVQPNVERLGAVKALASPQNAICMEFTDLFIALARAADIPAREINGFAYTENPQIQPLSLVADVLHSWPEYWNKEKEEWIPIDPTWGSTTKGLDFFSKLDLRHFTFVIHGQDPIKPYPPGSYKLGSNPQKDVFVNFGQLPDKRSSFPELSFEASPNLPFANHQISVKVYNPGPVALYNLKPEISFDGETDKGQSIDVLPPFATREFFLNVPFSFLGNKTPDKVIVNLLDQKVEIPTFKKQVIVYNLVAIFFLFLILVLLIILRVKRVTLFKIYSGIILKNAKLPEKSATDSESQAKP